MTQPQPVTAEDIDRIPAEHRRTIARWLLERAYDFEASFILSASAAAEIRQTLTGAAIDLAEPLSEDTTVSHGAVVVADLMSDRPAAPSRYDCDACSFATADIGRMTEHCVATGHRQRPDWRPR